MILLIVSFILDSIVSSVISINSYLLPAFTLVSLAFIYPNYKKNNTCYIALALLSGLLYDICFSSSLYINTLSFLAVSALIILIYHYINNNIFSFTLVNVLVISLYRFISYIIYILVSYKSFNINSVFTSIIHTLTLNIIYGILLYFICNFIKKKFNKNTYKYKKI